MAKVVGKGDFRPPTAAKQTEPILIKLDLLQPSVADRVIPNSLASAILASDSTLIHPSDS